jgi:hypothetical protein
MLRGQVMRAEICGRVQSYPDAWSRGSWSGYIRTLSMPAKDKSVSDWTDRFPSNIGSLQTLKPFSEATSGQYHFPLLIMTQKSNDPGILPDSHWTNVSFDHKFPTAPPSYSYFLTLFMISARPCGNWRGSGQQRRCRVDSHEYCFNNK